MKINFLHTSVASELFQIETASRTKPDWWVAMPFTTRHVENSPSDFADISTLKACPAIHSNFNMGYVIKAPMDFEIHSFDDHYEITFPNAENEYLRKNLQFGHVREQYEGFAKIADEFHDQTFKIYTDIYVTSTEPCNLFLNAPHWASFHRNIVMMDATLQISEDIYDRVGHAIIPNFLVKKNTKTLIKQGEPFIQVTPFNTQNVDAAVVTMYEKEHRDYFDNYQFRFFEKLLYTAHAKYRGFLREFMFKNRYTLRRVEPEDYFKWVKKSKNWPLFHNLLKRRK